MNIVTCFNADGYKLYGKNFLESFTKHWPKEIKLLAYYHDFGPDVLPNHEGANIEFICLDDNVARRDFLSKYGAATGNMSGQYNFRMDAVKFCNKVFAIADAAERPSDDGILVWLDADIVTKKDVSVADIRSWIKEDVTHLGRTAVNYSETSFIAFDLKSPRVVEFLSDFRDVYTTGELFGFSEWHDGFVFERLLTIHTWHGLKTNNLSEGIDSLDAFNNSVLGQFMEHKKGNKKMANPSVLEDGAGNKLTPLKIHPQNSVPDLKILENVKANITAMNKWLPRCTPRLQDKALIVSGGPSVKELIPAIKEMWKKGATLFCVKHSYQTLIDAGIYPEFCVILDPRPINEKSTHGFVRKDLIQEPHPSTTFLVAAMTSPEWIDHLKAKGAKIVGWHAYTKGIETILKQLEVKEAHMITGGTSAALRAFGIGFELGFRDFHFFAFDCCYYGDLDMNAKDELGRRKYLPVRAGLTGTDYFATGELVAQAQDLENLWQTAPYDVKLTMHGERGFGVEVVKIYQRPSLLDFNEWKNSD